MQAGTGLVWVWYCDVAVKWRFPPPNSSSAVELSTILWDCNFDDIRVYSEGGSPLSSNFISTSVAALHFGGCKVKVKAQICRKSFFDCFVPIYFYVKVKMCKFWVRIWLLSLAVQVFLSIFYSIRDVTRHCVLCRRFDGGVDIVVSYVIVVKYERIKFLVVALKDGIEIYAWAPKPYHKFMAFKVASIKSSSFVVF